MGRKSLLLPLAFQLGFLVLIINSQQFCGQAKPDVTKTCISIRLPWQRQPVFFCVDKTSFKYRNQCNTRYPTDCESHGNETLLVATPWECCPISTSPDSCADEKCSPPPFERKCQVIPPKEDDAFECCPTYFCEEDMTPEMCHLKLLEPTCNAPPEGKTNCVGFIDDHGCCPKYQCDEDAQEGECPAEAQAKKYMEQYATNDKGKDKDKPSVKGRRIAFSKMDEKMSNWSPPEHDFTACVGDFNCPGKLKCCSEDVYVYVSDRHGYLQRNRDPTNGYCMEPAGKNETKKSHHHR